MNGFYVLVMMLFQGNKIQVPLAKHPSSILLHRGCVVKTPSGLDAD